jgi:hypothetical protein
MYQVRQKKQVLPFVSLELLHQYVLHLSFVLIWQVFISKVWKKSPRQKFANSFS